MFDYQLILSVIFGILLLLTLILRFKIQAFIALLIASIVVGILSGMESSEIFNTVKDGMGNTLGFVAVVVGLGAMFGAILEHSGGAEALANYLINKFGNNNTSTALTITGFFIAIPVFFDVGFIILIPIIYSLQRKTKKSLLLYGIPLLAGLAITHVFIPPTPGPVAVADILNADLGWVILFGFITSIPTAIICGPLFGRYIANKIHVDAPQIEVTQHEYSKIPSVWSVLAIIGLPIFLIVVSTFIKSPLLSDIAISEEIKNWIGLIGHPFTALILANLIAWYILGIKKGVSKDDLLKITTKSMGPAGIIILLTGAGGVFKEMLVNTGAGEMLANLLTNGGMGILLFAFIVAAIIRILQGSATVAMITAAGLTAPVLLGDSGEIYKALIVLAIASGASILSHVNDSGFWLVSKYLGLTEKQTFKSWTIMTTLIAVVGFTTVSIISAFV